MVRRGAEAAWLLVALATLLAAVQGVDGMRLRCAGCRRLREKELACPVLLNTGTRPWISLVHANGVSPPKRRSVAMPRLIAHPPPTRRRCRLPHSNERSACHAPCAPDVPVPQTHKKPKQLPANASFANVPPRVDDYAWLRDDHRNQTAVLSHLQVGFPWLACCWNNAVSMHALLSGSVHAIARPMSAARLSPPSSPQEENAYVEAVLAPSQQLQARLFQEMLGRIPRQETSAPQRRRQHWYYRYGPFCVQLRRAGCSAVAAAAAAAATKGCLRQVQAYGSWSPDDACREVPSALSWRSVHGAGQQYRRYCRRRITNPDTPPSEHDVMDLAQPEETLLDQDEMAGGRSWLPGSTVAADAGAAAAHAARC